MRHEFRASTTLTTHAVVHGGAARVLVVMCVRVYACDRRAFLIPIGAVSTLTKLTLSDLQTPCIVPTRLATMRCIKPMYDTTTAKGNEQ